LEHDDPPEQTMDDDLLTRVRDYRQLAIHKDNAHYEMALKLRKRHTVLGVPVIVTTAIVSTAIFTTLESEPDIGWRVLTGLVSVAAAVLAGLQTFFNFAEQAQRHQASAVGYSRLRRRLEQFELRLMATDPQRSKTLDEFASLSDELDQLEGASLPIATKVYDEIRERFATPR
jgi:hypothetical protein